MKRCLRSSILLVVVVLSLSSNLPAQEFRNLELNAFVAGSGYTKTKFESGLTPGEFKLDDTLRGGLRLNLHTTRHWGEEFFFSYEPNEASFIRKGPLPQQQEFDIRVFNFGMNVMYYLNDEESFKTRPFLSFGIGGTMLRPTAGARNAARDPLRGNLPGFESSSSFAANYGVGFKRSLSDSWGFRMDVRGFVARAPQFGLSDAVFPISGATHSVEASLGLFVKIR